MRRFRVGVNNKSNFRLWEVGSYQKWKWFLKYCVIRCQLWHVRPIIKTPLDFIKWQIFFLDAIKTTNKTYRWICMVLTLREIREHFDLRLKRTFVILKVLDGGRKLRKVNFSNHHRRRLVNLENGKFCRRRRFAFLKRFLTKFFWTISIYGKYFGLAPVFSLYARLGNF